MSFMRRITSVFNLPTSLLVAGLLLIVAGVWIVLGFGFGLVALGVSLIVTALLINQSENEGR